MYEFDVSPLLAAAEKFVINNDRADYLPFFEAAEGFCAANQVVLGGKIGMQLLTRAPLSKDSFSWDLYADNTYNMARELAVELSRVKSTHIDPRFVAMRTDIKHKEFTIFVNTRLLFKVYNLDKHRGVKLVDLMGPATRAGYFTQKPLLCISEEIQLINIYRGLYSPGMFKLWEEYVAMESQIYTSIEGSIGHKAVTQIDGGALQVSRAPIDQVILKTIGDNCILLGDYAIAALLDGPCVKSPRVQFVSDRAIDQIAAEIEKALNREIKTFSSLTRITVTYVKYSLNIPSDFQITKHSLYLNHGGEQVSIADVFNSTAYELVPWRAAKVSERAVKVGNPFVLLRFKFIDLWVLKLILNLDSTSGAFVRDRIKALLDDVSGLREYAGSMQAFQLEDYGGVYVNETVAKKKLIQASGDRFPIFYPAAANSSR